MDITAQMVKELRDKTGAGMMDCKKALVESEGDMEKAMETLRQKGILSAEKKMGRIAAEGLVATSIKNNKGAMLELNCETDFVAKNEDFKELAQKLVEGIAEGEANTVEELLATNCPVLGKTIEEMIKEKIATIGEKITVRRFEKYEGNLSTYVHNGKIGVMLVTDKVNAEAAKDVCLHIASSAPEFLSSSDIPQSVKDEEKRIEMGKEDLQSKPENIREKIVEGRLHKILAQRCLLEQPFVKEPSLSVQQYIEGKFSIVKFDRYVLGEGLEKRSENFADEVMNQIKG
ncbi:MAG: translation elongation factor Ts [Candidatus Gastranaerophilaceae bacterium]